MTLNWKIYLLVPANCYVSYKPCIFPDPPLNLMSLICFPSGVRARRGGGALQGLPLHRRKHLGHQRRSHARTGMQYAAFPFLQGVRRLLLQL